MNWKAFVFIVLALFPKTVAAQFNVERLMTSGQIALHYEDYVLSIQYFNQVIALRPTLYQPWQLRAAAKYYLDDFPGAEADATEAISLNPYIEEIYDLRALSRIRQQAYRTAIQDYTQALKLNPTNQGYWINRAICRLNDKQYSNVHADIDTIISRWPKMAKAYALNAEVFLKEKDTLSATKWIDKSLAIDPYDGDTWTTKAYLSLSRKQWRQADTALTKAIHYQPKNAGNYVNRALARININNLRGAMSDYDTAIDIDPNNFLAHYNRGLLRMQLGDDNRAITDFDYVIKMEPGNIMAIFNRAVLLDRTGNLRAAIRDYTTVINQFPNFWTGLSYRASCYRRLGMNAKAELDEFRIIKAQMDKHIGIQPRWSKAQLHAVRKRNEINMDKYNQIVIADEEEDEHTYQSKFRGRIQNIKTEMEYMPMFTLSYSPYRNGVRSYIAYDSEVERWNMNHPEARRLYIACNSTPLTEAQSKAFFAIADSLSSSLRMLKGKPMADALLLRSVAYGSASNYDDAIADLDAAIATDSLSSLLFWQRGAYRQILTDYKTSKGEDMRLMSSKTIEDFSKAITLHPAAYLYYNRGNVHVFRNEYKEAIEDYTQAILRDPKMAEAYYNRGLAYIALGKNKEGISDLSKAGELGLYGAYSIIKQQGTKTTQGK